MNIQLKITYYTQNNISDMNANYDQNNNYTYAIYVRTSFRDPRAQTVVYHKHSLSSPEQAIEVYIF